MDIKAYFIIEKEIGNEDYIQSFIYLKDTSKLLDINNYLCSFYKGKYKQSLNISYYDTTGIVPKELSSVNRRNISIEELVNSSKNLSQHLLVVYDKQANKEGQLIFNNRLK